MLLCIIMVLGTISIGALVYCVGMFYMKFFAKDVNVKAQDFVEAWWTPEAKADVDACIRERKGALIRKRILVETFKKNVNNRKFVDVMAQTRAFMPPDFVLGNLAYVTLPIAA